MNLFKRLFSKAKEVAEEKPSLMKQNEEITKESFPEAIRRKMKESKEGRILRMLSMNHRTFFVKGFEIVALNRANALKKALKIDSSAEIKDIVQYNQSTI